MSVLGRGPYVFKIHGELYHQQGSLLPPEDTTASYAQLYIYEANDALQGCQANNPTLMNDQGLMGDVQEMLLVCNPFVPLYKQAIEHFQETERQLEQAGQDPTAASDLQAKFIYCNDQDLVEIRSRFEQ